MTWVRRQENYRAMKVTCGHDATTEQLRQKGLQFKVR